MAASSSDRIAESNANPAGETGPLSPEMSHFLIEFSIALHRTGSYPADHPALESAIRSLTLRLDRLLAVRSAVLIGVTRERLLIDGGATDESNAVLRSLAESLHRHEIGSIRFERGVSSAEVSALLHEAGRDAGRSAPLGAPDAAVPGEWPHIRLAPVALDQLQIAGDTRGASSPEGLWLEFAHALLPGEEDLERADRPASDLAAAIRCNVRDSSHDRVVVDSMVQLGQALDRHGGAASSVARRIGDLIEEVGQDTLELLLDRGSDMTTRHQLVRDMSRVLPARSVVALTRAAAAASKAPISGPLLGLFAKMAANAESEAGPVSVATDSALRDAINVLVDDWSLADPNPESYRDVHRAPSADWRTDAGAGDDDPWADAVRMLDIALETDAVGPAVWRAVNELIRLGRLDDLLETLHQKRDSEAARRIQAHLGRPEQMGTLLRSRQSRHAVEQLLRWSGVEAADALLDGLEATDSRGSRRRIIERLVRMGGAIADRVIARLERGPWYVQRNMLHLLSQMDDLPPDFNPAPWLESEDRRVRREAIRVALRVPESRAAAIVTGVAENDSRILSLSLNAALEACPPGIAPALIRHLDDPATSPAIRLAALRVLGRTRTSAARKWLLARVLEKTRWWRRPRLAPKSREMLLALSALRSWRSNRDVALVLALARESDDIEVRFAATASTDGWQ